jgi:hypothetical protein
LPQAPTMGNRKSVPIPISKEMRDWIEDYNVGGKPPDSEIITVNFENVLAFLEEYHFGDVPDVADKARLKLAGEFCHIWRDDEMKIEQMRILFGIMLS